MKTTDEFLEELKEYLKECSNYHTGHLNVIWNAIDKIEQFQAEQKQVSDDN